MVRRLIVDPPSGWKYGFPKALPEDYKNNKYFSFEKWLIAEGYPQDLIKLASKYSRYWEDNEE